MRTSVLSEVWKPKYDLKDATIEQDIAEAPPTYNSLQALLQRGMQPFPEDIKLTVEVTGIYGLA